MTKEIQLTQNMIAVVDAKDYELLNQYRWFPQKGVNTYYAIRNSKKSEGFVKRKTISMHRQLLNFPNSHTDHINGDGLDNRRKNIRTCTMSQNQQNRSKRLGFSIYKGVRWHKHSKRWTSRINVSGKSVFLGSYKCEIKAAKAYDKAAAKYYKEFANLNFTKEFK